MKKNGNKLFFCSASVVVEAQKVINNVAIGTGFSLYFHYFRKVREDKAGGRGWGCLFERGTCLTSWTRGCALIRRGGEGAYSGGARSFGGCALIRGGEGAYSRKYRNCIIESNTPAK